MASWSVVTTVKEPLDVVLRFVSFHLDVGAARIYVYFDDPDDAAYEVIKDHPQVTAVRRPADFWADKSLGNPKFRHLGVQNFNAMEAYSQMDTDWLAFVDGDEYLYSPMNIDDVLDECTGDIVIARSSEPAFVNEESFGMPLIVHSRLKGDKGKVFSPINPEFNYQGLIGHSGGKSFFRKGQKIERMRVHKPEIADAKVEVMGEDKLTLIHYLNFGSRIWAEKLARRLEMGRYKVNQVMIEKANGRKPREQMWHEAYGQGGVEGLIHFFNTYKIYADEYASKVPFFAHLSDFKFDFSKAMERHFGVTEFQGQNETTIFSAE